MKNIFLLPTDRPSRLVLRDADSRLVFATPITQHHGKYQHIYITSDEEIKKGDYRIMIDKTSAFYGTFEKHLGKHECNDQWKKVVLATDPTLIADGVQAIDDEFLEWFVKNPTCEYVPIITTIVSNSPTYKPNIGFESWRKEEIIPVQALSEPDGTGILSAMDVVEPFKNKKVEKTKFSLTNRDISVSYQDESFYLMLSDFRGAMAYWLAAQSPKSGIDINRPLNAFTKYLQQKYFRESDQVRLFSYTHLDNLISEDIFIAIPELLELNEIEGPDFYDLGALARNVFYMILREQITQPL